MRTVVIGMLGSTLDQGFSRQRWYKWRPTVSLGQQPDLLVDRMELLFSAQHQRIANFVIKDLAVVSPETLVVPRIFELKNPWDFEEVYAALFDFAKAYPFDPEREDYLVHITTGTHVLQICLFLLLESRHIPARIIQTSPPSFKDKEINPAGIYGVIDLDLSRYDRLAERFRVEVQEHVNLLKSGIDTRNPAFNAMIERLEKVAGESTEPILLTGPTGAGKSRLAQLIYDLRRLRRQVKGEFVEINCATLRGDSAMSTLFGHKRGAFTGATADRAGLLRQADGGVLFLDEVGELGPDEQAMLLRAIEVKRFYPLGSDTEAASDFQLICGSNRPLAKLAATGGFRPDLLARINLWSFRLPGIVERPEDIEPNLDYELDRYAEKTGRQARFNREARELFLALATGGEARWSGNFRDLAGSVRRMGALSDGGRITTAIVREEWGRLRQMWVAGTNSGLDAEGADQDEDILARVLGEEAGELDRFEALQLAGVIRECSRFRSLSEAGRALFARSRQKKTTLNDADRLRKYLAKFGLTWENLWTSG